MISLPKNFHLKGSNPTRVKNFLLKNPKLKEITKNSKNFPLDPAILSYYQVDLLTRIPKSPHLHFYDFSTIYYEFPKLNTHS
jgi:hypothetical protein